MVELGTYHLPLNIDLSLITYHGPFGGLGFGFAGSNTLTEATEGPVQAHSVRVPSTVEGRQGCRSWTQLLTLATVRKRRGMDADAQLTASVLFSQEGSAGNGVATLMVGLYQN